MTVESWDPGAAAPRLDERTIATLLDAAGRLEAPRFGLDAARAGELATCARHEPEAQLIVSLLAALETPALVRRTTMDVPEMLAGGPREVLVPSDRALEARALLDPMDDEARDTDGDHARWREDD